MFSPKFFVFLPNLTTPPTIESGDVLGNEDYGNKSRIPVQKPKDVQKAAAHPQPPSPSPPSPSPSFSGLWRSFAARICRISLEAFCGAPPVWKIPFTGLPWPANGRRKRAGGNARPSGQKSSCDGKKVKTTLQKELLVFFGNFRFPGNLTTPPTVHQWVG